MASPVFALPCFPDQRHCPEYRWDLGTLPEPSCRLLLLCHSADISSTFCRYFQLLFYQLLHEARLTVITVRFYRAMLCIRGTSHFPVSVCPSVRPSVRPSQVGVLLKRLKVGSHTTPHDTTGTLVFWCQRSPRNSTGVTPYEGAECRWGGQNRRLSTNSQLYLENGIR